MTNKTILNASQLQKDYSQGNAGAVLEVIKNIDLEISEGEKLAIIGVSGSGKSTLLNLLGGLDDPTHGAVSLNGKQWSQLSPTDRAAWRNQHISLMPTQESQPMRTELWQQAVTLEDWRRKAER